MSKALLCALLALLGLSPAIASAQPAQNVGVITTLSGMLAVFGTEANQALELLPDALRKRFNIIRCDDGASPARADECASRLVGQDKVVAVVGPVLTGSDMSVRRRLADSKTLHLSLAGPGPRAERPSTYFRIREDQGELLSYAATYVRDSLKPKELTVVTPPPLLAAGRTWKDFFPESGVSYVAIASLGLPDLEKAADAAAAQPADTVFFAGNARPIELVVLSRRLSSKKLVFVTSSRVGANLQAAPNLTIVAPGPLVNDAGRKFEEAYQKAFKGPPSTYIPHHTIAAFEVLDAVLPRDRLAGSEESARLVQSRSFDTVVGKLRFDRLSGEALAVIPKVVIDASKGPALALLAQSTGGTACNCAGEECCRKACCNNNCNGRCNTRTAMLSPPLALVSLLPDACDEPR
jgi:branched-chain amino acid transport system substrate-binding protein